jgi:hypothetical protein
LIVLKVAHHWRAGREERAELTSEPKRQPDEACRLCHIVHAQNGSVSNAGELESGFVGLPHRKVRYCESAAQLRHFDLKGSRTGAYEEHLHFAELARTSSFLERNRRVWTRSDIPFGLVGRSPL